jgi:hypothetical protein
MRVQKPGLVVWAHMHVHPDENDDGEDGEHANDDAGGSFRPVGGGQGLLDKGEFCVGIF